MSGSVSAPPITTAERRAEFAAGAPEGPVRDCRHQRRGHAHGTRSSYVADRCRCTSCTEANRRHAQSRARARAYERWQPYTDASPVREHVQRLRQAGLGVERIIALSGLGSGTVRQLLYGDSRTGEPVVRVRTQTAEKLLALHPERDVPAGGSLCDAASTRRMLDELIEDGWSLQHLARLLDTDTKRLRATMARDQIRSATARRVAGLYVRLTASATEVAPYREPALTKAGQRPMLAEGASLGDVQATQDGLGSNDYIDEVAVARAIDGLAVRLTPREQLEVISQLTERGRSLRSIAALLHTSPRTVSRRRARLQCAG